MILNFLQISKWKLIPLVCGVDCQVIYWACPVAVHSMWDATALWGLPSGWMHVGYAAGTTAPAASCPDSSRVLSSPSATTSSRRSREVLATSPSRSSNRAATTWVSEPCYNFCATPRLLFDFECDPCSLPLRYMAFRVSIVEHTWNEIWGSHITWDVSPRKMVNRYILKERDAFLDKVR